MPAVHDLRVSDGKRGPSRQDLRAVHSQTAVCGAFRIHNAHILPKPAHFGYTAAKCCHEPAFFPSEAPSGTHEAKKPPRITAWERIGAKYCQDRQSENAPWRYLAAADPSQECFSMTSSREGPRLPGLAAKSQWCNGIGRCRPNEASANSTTHANTSKKP